MRHWIWGALLALIAMPVAASDAAVESAGDDAPEIGAGQASYFHREMAGRRTASGEICDPATLTAAHRTLPFGDHIRVTNQSNGQSVIVRVNDRGPFARGRVIDISYAAAREIGMHRSGTARVTLTQVDG